MGKGAGTLILESLQHATRRKAYVYAEVAGYATTSEAYHMVIPKEDGLDIGRTMTLALQNAKAEPKQVDYVNAHATSTIIGDEVEVRGLRAVFGKSVEKILVNATKSLIGHTLGASGAIAAIVSTLSLDQSVIHPTVNYTNPDPNCALPGISPKTQKKSLRMALVNAFGFGSNIAVLVLKKFFGDVVAYLLERTGSTHNHVSPPHLSTKTKKSSTNSTIATKPRSRSKTSPS